jgi:DNA-binding response OmpR family regulator
MKKERRAIMYKQMIPADVIFRRSAATLGKPQAGDGTDLTPCLPLPNKQISAPSRFRVDSHSSKLRPSIATMPMNTTKILIIDDDYEVRNALAKLLEAERYQVYSAEDAREALKCFKSRRISLVILDLNLRFESGWQVFQEMTETDPFVPTIIITGEWGQQERAAKLGVEGLIEKPIDVPVFLEMIRGLLVETPEARLERICGQNEYFRHVVRQIEPILDEIEQRLTAPLQLSTDLRAALQSRTTRGSAGDHSVNLDSGGKVFIRARKQDDNPTKT